ncbi:prolyl hydroxylase family protein [Croceicoccus sediminis]|uniref:prolyl hydroxylase family protein n=1 Tax=Croceicoccus sediminis TaxID=2571150 RepID=UPI001183C7FB|nr:2OG-Fe(II) oxygenase [Croceicoccus sediminis]
MAKTGRTDKANQREIAAMNEAVLARLKADDSVQVLVDDKLQLFGIPDFFSPEECERLMKMVDDTARPSPVFDVDYGKQARTSYSGDLDPYNPFVRMLHRRMDDLMGVPENWGETMQGQRYAVGQQFKAHHDWFDTSQPYWTGEVSLGGQRAWTLMVYLNDVEEGGSTDFPKANIAVPPQQGTLIAWSNANADGKVNMETLHAGTPVVKGVKYVVTRWYRARAWY